MPGEQQLRVKVWDGMGGTEALCAFIAELPRLVRGGRKVPLDKPIIASSLNRPPHPPRICPHPCWLSLTLI